MQSPKYIVPAVVLTIYCLATTLLFAFEMKKSDFIARRAPIFSLVATLCGLIHFNVIFQHSKYLFPTMANNAPYLFRLISRNTLEAIYLFSYLIRVIHVVLAFYINEVHSVEEEKRSLSSAQIGIIKILLCIIWVKPTENPLTLASKVYSNKRLLKIMASMAAILAFITLLIVILSRNDFLSDILAPRTSISSKHHLIFLWTYYVIIGQIYVVSLIITRNGTTFTTKLLITNQL